VIINIHKANERGYSDFGWLKSHFTFSFAEYFNPLRQKFGVIRALNDEVISPHSEFAVTSYKNIELLFIPISGELSINTDANYKQTVKTSQIQLISAGTGIQLTLANKSDEPLHLIQLWIYSKEKNLSPGFQISKLDSHERNNRLQLIASPSTITDALRINQNAWISQIDMQNGSTLKYRLFDEKNQLLIFLLEGELKISEEQFDGHIQDEKKGPSQHSATKRDSIEITDIKSSLSINCIKECCLLIVEVPED
jgi:hypothetical protein